jgi:lysyl-tRNA synthetase class 2
VERARVLRAIRGFLDARGYVEIEAPLLVVSPGLEPQLDAFKVPTGGPRRYLHTSPEYALKRLLGEGMERLYSMGPCFRDEPSSRTHSPEFTMLEWYRVGFDLTALMDETEALVSAVCDAVHGHTVTPGGVELGGPWERLTMRQAFSNHAGFDPLKCSTTLALRQAARAAGHKVHTTSEAWDDVFFQVFLNAVEPKLGRARPTILSGWPASQAALARLDPADPKTALRFEVYAGGQELANAFDELTDPAEQRRRFESDLATRKRERRQTPPIDERLLAALGRMRPTCGIALGVDRLGLLVTGADHIDEVRAQPWTEASAEVARR